MFIIEKRSLDSFWGLTTFGGVKTFGDSLFSGFIRSPKLLKLLSGGRYYGNFTVACRSTQNAAHYPAPHQIFSANM